jgi:hypothetical protein
VASPFHLGGFLASDGIQPSRPSTRLIEIDDLSPSTRQLWSDINFESGKLPDDQNESIIVEGMVELAMRVAAECGRVGSES